MTDAILRTMRKDAQGSMGRHLTRQIQTTTLSNDNLLAHEVGDVGRLVPHLVLTMPPEAAIETPPAPRRHPHSHTETLITLDVPCEPPRSSHAMM